MSVNKRNFYRILHVQPEAPALVITASYRTMMSKLRLHPDLGGDTAGAALINEAYAALSDPVRRRQYDLSLKAAPSGRQRASSSTTAGPVPTAADHAAASGLCRFCRAPAPAGPRPDSRCERCDSPLAPPPAQTPGRNEIFGRRKVPRMSRTDAVTLIVAWQAPASTAQLRDLSIAGISILIDKEIEQRQVIRVIGPLFDVLASVVSHRRVGRRVEVHAALLSALFSRHKNVLVSVKA